MTEENNIHLVPNKQSNSQDVIYCGAAPSLLCRLCACGDKRMVSIYGDEGTRMALAYKINKQLPIMISPKNKLPLEVCQECIAELNSSLEFVKRCVENQTKLRQMLHLSVEDCNTPNQDLEKIENLIYIKNRRKSTGISKYKPNDKSKHNKDPSMEGSCKEVVQSEKLKKLKLVQEIDHDEDDDICILRETKTNEYQEHGLPPSNNTDLSIIFKCGSNEKTEKDSLDVKALQGQSDISNSSEIESKDKLLDVTVEDDVEFKHICKYCDKGFLWKAELFAHQTRLHPDLVSRCSFCLKVFYDKEEFYLHELAHRKQLPPGFRGRISLRQHLKGGYHKSDANKLGEKLITSFAGEEKGNNSRQSCTEVAFNIRSEKQDCFISDSYNSDKKDDDENDKKCNYCNIYFNTVREQRKHIKSNHKVRLPCRFCPRTLSYDFELKKHEAMHQKGEKKCLFCKICRKSFSSHHLLKEHELLHFHPDGFQCEICMKVFYNESDLEEHVQTHAGESSYLCEICGQNVDSFVIFRLHKMDHMHNECHKCKLCHKSFSSVTDLKNHEQRHYKKKKLVCKTCDKTFPTSDLLKEHKLCHDSEEYKCESCDKSFTSSKKLKNHIQTHSLERNYLCEKCGKDFKSNSSLHKHRYLCQVAIACNVCSKEFDCNTRLKVHMRIHTGEKPFVCSVCGKGFHASWSLSQHSATHNTVKIPCPLCGALFNRKSNMLTHKRRHRVPCETCGQVFANTPLLLLHQKTHTGSGEGQVDGGTLKEDSSVAFRCEQCGKLFVTGLDLKAHMSTHSDERPYKCEICGKSWRLQKTLKKHMITHSGRKPYQCRYCTCTFLLHQRLVKHENGHTAGKPYTCQECGQSFWTQLNLEKHSIRHCAINSTDKKYSCNFCSKSFERKSTLMIHKRTHSAQLSYGCTFCPRKFSQLRFAQRHKCALDPNNQITTSSAQEGLFSSISTLAEEESCSADENACPDVLNEEIVYDMDPVSTPYAEIIVISQSMGDLIVENNSELNKSD